MSNFEEMLEWINNLTVNFSARGELKGYTRTWIKEMTPNLVEEKKVEYRFPAFITFNLQFSNLHPMEGHLEYLLLLYPKGINNGNHTNALVIKEWDKEKITDVYSTIEGKKTFICNQIELRFGIENTINNLAQSKGLVPSDCMYILYVRTVNDNEHNSAAPSYWPNHKNGQARFVAFSETLMHKAKQPSDYSVTDMYSTHSKYGIVAGKRKADAAIFIEDMQTRFTVGCPQVLIGTEDEIFKQLNK